MTPAQQPRDTTQAPEPPGTPAAAPRRQRRRVVASAVIVLLAIGGFLIWRGVFSRRPPENVISLSGRIEGDDSA